MKFPALDAEETLGAVRGRWDLRAPLPRPLDGWLACPVCRSPEPQPRYWQFHTMAGVHTLPWRCDISFKCTSCSAVWIHGLPLDEETWERCKRSGRIGWRQARRILDEES